MHFVRYIVFGLLSTVGALGEEVTATLDGDFIRSQAAALTSLFPNATPFTDAFTAPGGNLLQPPTTLVGAIITAVPPTVLAQLLMPSGRSSIASEFQAGNTPAWYQDLPEDVKAYVLAMKSQVAAGSVNLSATPTEVATQTGGDGSASPSPSTDLAARPTGEVVASLASVLGLLGFLVML